ncbi:hypothetical protein Tco_0628518 [Tanacetum coccineum]|uniref:Uncharacterized protein n=1 Tax=Tanacetum coccineum TaxID=301880 RepID=A0ABQ4WRA2_9ASTR
MNPTAQQIALDNALVALKNRVKIGICNMRTDPTKTPKEPTYEVVLDALALTTCYLAFSNHSRSPKNIYASLLAHHHQDKLCIQIICTNLREPLLQSSTDSFLGIPQIDKRDFKKQEKMYYPIFTKAIIQHFISKDKSIFMRNRLFIHTVQDDSVLGSLRLVSKIEEYQVYGALIPTEMTNLKMRKSPTYKTYLAYATGAIPS